MTRFDIQRRHRLARHGNTIGREGMSKLVAEAVADYRRQGETYKGAMILAGRLKAVSEMAALDDYWREQVDKGVTFEYHRVLAGEKSHA